ASSFAASAIAPESPCGGTTLASLGMRSVSASWIGFSCSSASSESSTGPIGGVIVRRLRVGRDLQRARQRGLKFGLRRRRNRIRGGRRGERGGAGEARAFEEIAARHVRGIASAFHGFLRAIASEPKRRGALLIC